LHLDGAETAARLGKHVLCEKPIETTEKRAEEMIRVCAEAGLTLMIAYRMRLDPVMRRLRAVLDGGSSARRSSFTAPFPDAFSKRVGSTSGGSTRTSPAAGR
jgi:predicted dehydrogenase